MKKGFTLIELLSVIVILAIISVIAVPTLIGVVNKVKLQSLKDSAYGLIESSNLYYAQYGSNNYRFNINGSNVTSNDTDKLLSFKGNVKNGVSIIKSNGKTVVCVTDGKNSAYKNYNEEKVNLISGKVCTIPSNTSIVYLDGEATLDEINTTELLDRISQLENKLDEFAKKSELQQVNTNLSTTISEVNTSLTNKINASLNKTLVGTQSGDGSKNVTVDLSVKKSITCITKKSGVIVETKEIPTSVLESGDVVLLGNTSPVIGVEPKENLSGVTTQEELVGKQLAEYLSSGSYPALFYDANDKTNYQGSMKSIGLATDSSQSTGAQIKYNGSNSFTITVTDSGLSVYILA